MIYASSSEENPNFRLPGAKISSFLSSNIFSEILIWLQLSSRYGLYDLWVYGQQYHSIIVAGVSSEIDDPPHHVRATTTDTEPTVVPVHS